MEKTFAVSLWPGFGYGLNGFEVKAECEEQAIEKVVVDLINDGMKAYYLTEAEHTDMCERCGIEDEMNDDQYMYVDATMEGAPYPVWLLIENAKINQVKGE